LLHSFSPIHSHQAFAEIVGSILFQRKNGLLLHAFSKALLPESGKSLTARPVKTDPSPLQKWIISKTVSYLEQSPYAE